MEDWKRASDASASYAAEVTRRLRLADQTISMHSTLRDRLSRRATVVQAGILIASFGLIVISLAPDALLARWGLPAQQTRDVSLLLSCIVFALGLVEILVDTRGRAALHADAARRLYIVKSSIASAKAKGKLTAATSQRLIYDYDRASEVLRPIPEADFASLKAAHLRKVRISRFLSRYPNHPIWLLRLRFLLRDVRRFSDPPD